MAKSLLPAFPRVQPPEHMMRLLNPKPGVEIMAAIDQLAQDASEPLLSDPFLRQMILRHRNMLAEGEGEEAAREYGEIDAQVALIVIHCLKRRKVKGMSVRACTVLSPDRLRITLIINGKGHEARRYIEIPLR